MSKPAARVASEGLYNPEFGLALGKVREALSAYFVKGVQSNSRQLFSSKALVTVFGLGIGGFCVLSAKELLRLKRGSSHQNNAALAVQSGGKTKKGARKLRISATSIKFWRMLWTLLKICVPSVTSKGARLLLVQFFLLIARTVLDVKAVKTNIYFLTKAISEASWSYWGRYVASFVMWMFGGMVVNSGLRWTETSIALEFRTQLTRYAHAKYMQGNNFYRLGVLREGNLDNLDGRITADIALWCREIASLYGHSFKPALVFVLSLYEASKDLGLTRPLVLFSWSILSNILLSPLQPNTGRMIVESQQREGDFRHAHSRLIGHAEEIAFLNGKDTEKTVLNAHMTVLLDTLGIHAQKKRFLKA